MARSYFLRMFVLVPFMLSGVSVLSKATGYFNGTPYFSNPYSAEYRNGLLPNLSLNKQYLYNPYLKDSNPLFLSKSYQWLAIRSGAKKEGEKATDIVEYQAEDSIVFNAKNKILSLYGASALAYGNMKLQANVVDLHFNANTIYAQGTRDIHNKYIGNPVFTYKDVTKDKYGKEGSTQTRIFFMDKICYNIDTKRALVDGLLTKQEESIIKSKQVKKEDEETFYAQDIIYTTCGLAHPHFYIRAKRVKMVQDKQITTGSFRFYFDNVPTPLGYMFGALFLEGKRTHGIIPPEIGESENGFYLRNGGYYINFNDYADVSILGSIYSSGIREFKNELRYKKRYQCSGDLSYVHNITGAEKGWSLKWAHKTLKRGHRSFNANIDLHNRSYKTLNYEDTKKSKKLTQQSSGSLSYQDKLMGLPYQLIARAEYNNNLLSNFQDWSLPKGTLTSPSWYPFRRVTSKGRKSWLHNIQLKHTINFENHFQNSKKEPTARLLGDTPSPVPSTAPWNRYTESGMKHAIQLSMQTKAFEFINLKPHVTYNEGWYWLKKNTKGPIRVPGFNRVYTWYCGAELGTILYHTHYFEEGGHVQAFRIKAEPSVDFTYTPDFSNKYFEKSEDQSKKRYAFEGLRPGLSVTHRATSILTFKFHNTVELKVEKETDVEKKEKKRGTRKIFLLKSLDFETNYDLKAEKCRLIDGIQMHIASDAKMGQISNIGFDLTTSFDPYLSETIALDNDTIKEEPINHFAWDYGQYLGKVKAARFKLNIDFTHYSNKDKKRKKELLSSHDYLTSKAKENKIDFEAPWNFGCEFNWIYKKLYEYDKDKKDYSIEKYVNLNGNITLVKKWKVGLRSTYNFSQNKFDPSATEISIQRDLHCWQLSYQWHPLDKPTKYDFSLGVKANVLKVLKLPRKRSYNKLS